MKVFQLQDNWSIDNLTLTERPKPEPGPGQVLLQMKAASLNFRDLLVPKRGYGALTGTLPLIPISDGVGEVIATGEGVRRHIASLIQPTRAMGARELGSNEAREWGAGEV